MELKFYRCRHCGNIVTYLNNSGVKVVCCGEKMEELIPNTVDAAQEKHVPVFTVEGNKVVVTVGSVEHPMTPEHLIECVAIQTEQGVQIKHLKDGMKPTVTFSLAEGDKLVKVFEYCNLHGLWQANG